MRDSAGVAQIGAVVELLRPDLSVIASVYTDAKGLFAISIGVSRPVCGEGDGHVVFAVARENVRVRTSTVVNLTLSTLYEVMQWLPAEPRGGNAQKDDWKWTLRSAANRPLLRWLEDGPLVVVTDGSGAAPKLKARLMATGQEGTFGESGERISAIGGRNAVQQPRVAGERGFCPGHRCRHGIDAWLPPGSGICRFGSIGGGDCRSS